MSLIICCYYAYFFEVSFAWMAVSVTSSEAEVDHRRELRARIASLFHTTSAWRPVLRQQGCRCVCQQRVTLSAICSSYLQPMQRVTGVQTRRRNRNWNRSIPVLIGRETTAWQASHEDQPRILVSERAPYTYTLPQRLRPKGHTYELPIGVIRRCIKSHLYPVCLFRYM